MKDDASELRIAIGRVLERWQLERASLDSESPEQQKEREMLTRHIEDLKRAVTPAPIRRRREFETLDAVTLGLGAVRIRDGAE